MKQQQEVAAITSDEPAPEWMIQIHDTIYRNIINHYVPTMDPTGRYPIDVQPNSYTPLLQLIQYRLSPSEHYKLDSAARARIKFALPDFPLLITRLQDLTPRIRAFYSRQLAVSDHDLACIMAIDGLFLLDIFINYREKKDTLLKTDPSKSKHNHAGLIRDILSPRNCFPFFVLEEIISSTGNPDDRYLLLPLRLLDFCADVSPFPLPPVYPTNEVHPPLHLLDLLYRLVMFGNYHSAKSRSKSNSNSNSNSGRGRSFGRRLADAIFELFDIPRMVREKREEWGALTPPAGLLEKYGSIRFEPVGGFEAMRLDAETGVMYLREVNLRGRNITGEVMRILLEYESYSVSDDSKRILRGYHGLMGSLGYYEESLEEASVVSVSGRTSYDSEFGHGRARTWAAGERERERRNFRRIDKVGEMVDAVNSYYDRSFEARWTMMRGKVVDGLLCCLPLLFLVVVLICVIYFFWVIVL